VIYRSMLFCYLLILLPIFQKMKPSKLFWLPIKLNRMPVSVLKCLIIGLLACFYLNNDQSF